MNIRPSFNEHLLITIHKLAAIIVFVLVVTVSIIILPAGGHPPGIVFLPFLLAGVAIIGLVLVLTYFSLKVILSRYQYSLDNPRVYSISIVVVNVYFLYLLLKVIYSFIPYAQFVTPGFSVYKIIYLFVLYAVLAGTMLQKKWARYMTIIILLMPVLIKFYWFVQVDGRIGSLSFSLVKLIIVMLFSIWVMVDYSINSKVKNYFSK